MSEAERLLQAIPRLATSWAEMRPGGWLERRDFDPGRAPFGNLHGARVILDKFDEGLPERRS